MRSTSSSESRSRTRSSPSLVISASRRSTSSSPALSSPTRSAARFRTWRGDEEANHPRHAEARASAGVPRQAAPAFAAGVLTPPSRPSNPSPRPAAGSLSSDTRSHAHTLAPLVRPDVRTPAVRPTKRSTDAQPGRQAALKLPQRKSQSCATLASASRLQACRRRPARSGTGGSIGTHPGDGRGAAQAGPRAVQRLHELAARCRPSTPCGSYGRSATGGTASRPQPSRR